MPSALVALLDMLTCGTVFTYLKYYVVFNACFNQHTIITKTNKAIACAL